jgi:hypothetical protein
MPDDTTPFAGYESAGQQIAAYMNHDQQGVAVFLGNGEVAIYHDDGVVMGNASELSVVQRTVTVARLRAVADMIEAGA